MCTELSNTPSHITNRWEANALIDRLSPYKQNDPMVADVIDDLGRTPDSELLPFIGQAQMLAEHYAV